MESTKVNFLSGSLSKNIFLFSVPLMFSNILQILFNTVDIAVIGHFAGSLALGAVGSTPMLLFLYTGMLLGISLGVNAIIAYYIGAKNSKEILDSVHSAFIVCLSFGIALMLLGIFSARPVLTLMNTKPELIDNAVLYFQIYMLGLPGISLYNFGSGILNATGDTKRPLFFLLIAGTVNIVLDLFFVAVLHFDCAGVAFASAVAQIVSAVLILIPLFNGTNGIKISLAKLKPNKQKIIQILKIGFPAGLQNAIFAIANVFIQTGINSFDAITVAGISAAGNADPFSYNLMAAFYSAGSTFIGQNFGAQNKKRILKSYFLSMLFAFCVAIIMGSLIWTFRIPFLSVFTKDEFVINPAIKRLKIMCLSYSISAFMDATTAASRGLGHTFVPSIFVILGSCVFRIIWIYTAFAHFKTIESLFAIYPFSWAITAIFEIIYFVIAYKKETAGFKK